MNNNMDTSREGVEMETKRVRSRHHKPPQSSEDEGLIETVAPMESVNSTDMVYDWNNNTFFENSTSETVAPMESINSTDMAYDLNNSTLFGNNTNETVAPIQSIKSTDMAYDLNNNTLLGNSTNSTNADATTYSGSDMFWTMCGPFLLLFFCTFGMRSHVPSSQYHRGELFRRQAERVWAIQEAKAEREAIPVETRKTQIEESLHRMKIVSKCPETGHCILGPSEVEEQETADDENDEDVNEASQTEEDEENSNETQGLEHASEETSASSNDETAAADATSERNVEGIHSPPSSSTEAAAPNVVAAAPASSSKKCAKCPQSPGRSERRPLLSPDSEDSEDNFGIVEEPKELPTPSSNSSPPAPSQTPSFYDDDDDVCPICLDNFEVGDMVMWSRHNHGSCSHAFHEDCLLQWLLEQRENECPTCRACFIATPDTDDSLTSSSSSSTDENENSTAEAEGTASSSTEEKTVDENQGDIEQGNSTNGDNIDDENNTRGDCNPNDDEMADQEHKSDCTENEETDILDKVEEGWTYIIVKGSVQQVSLLV
jgi:hypothetical protein